MGNYLVVVGTEDARGRADALFARGVERMGALKGQEPNAVIEAPWARVATFSRRNGSGGHLATDDATGDFLCAIGTWVHPNGLGSGDELGLLERLREVGPERLGRELDGFFVLVAGDRGARQITVITDLIGSCHAFARDLGGAVASSGSALVLAALAPTTPDPLAAQEFVRTGVLYEDRTPYADVKKLAPSAVTTIKDGALQTPRAFWSMGELVGKVLPADDAIERWGAAVITAARRLDGLFERQVCDLTGGYDSRALAALLRTAGVEFETTVVGPPNSADVRISSGLAARCGFRHHHLPNDEPVAFADVESAIRLCDGEVNAIAYARIQRVHDALRQRFDASLNGSFGEVARGYYWELLFPGLAERTPLDAERIARARYAAGAASPSLWRETDRVDLAEHFTGVIRRTNTGLPDAPRTFQLDHTYLRMRMRCWQGRIATATNQIWPCVSPFMFRSAIEPVLQSEPRARLRGLLVRRLIERHQPEMAAYRLADGHPAQPLRWNNAHRFAPLAWRYAAKVLRRLRPGGTGNARPPGPSARAHLAGDPAVRAVLDPETMRLAPGLDRNALARFLDRQDPGDDLAWERLLTLELALRAAQA